MQERSDIECTFLERPRGKQSRSDQGRKRCDSKNHLRGVIMLILAEVPKRSMVPYRVITPARAPSDNVNMRRR